MISYFYHVIKLTLFILNEKYIFLIKKDIYLCSWQEEMSLSFSFLVLKNKDKNYDNII
jgi:hypothetical protein